MLMDRAAITVMVEEFWRSFIPVAYNGDESTAILIVERFQKQIEDMTALMPTSEAARFAQMVDEERGLLFDEYNANPEKLKARLGIITPIVPPKAVRVGEGMDLGRLAVRTTVRAAVWESVISLFRLAR